MSEGTGQGGWGSAPAAARLHDRRWPAVPPPPLARHPHPDTRGRAHRMCRAVVAKMVRAKRGRIVNITSVVGTLGNPGQANYAASKAGVEAFSRSLARELGSRNITINCVAPGFIDTDMTRALDAKQRDALMSQVPLGRLGTPHDVAAAVAFLVGSGATYVTGVTLHVNGGMHM